MKHGPGGSIGPAGEPGAAAPPQPKAATRHARIVGHIRSQIVGGHWPPGYHLPIETDLAERYGVSRMTMNKALAELTREGFLVRRKKSGTQVAQPRGQSVAVAIADIGDEVRLSGRTHRFRLRDQRLRPATAADALSLGEAIEGRTVLWLEGLHLADERPFCLETRLVNPATAIGAERQDFSRHAPGAWLLKTVPWSVASHRIRAVNASVAEARGLDLAVGEACLEIVRRTRVEADWVTWVRLLYPGGGHQLVADFGPHGGEAHGRDSRPDAVRP